MVLWIVAGVLLLGLLVLALAVRAVLVRLPRLGRAVGVMSRRQVQAEALQARLLVLQKRMAATQEQAELAQRNAAIVRARRSPE